MNKEDKIGLKLDEAMNRIVILSKELKGSDSKERIDEIKEELAIVVGRKRNLMCQYNDARNEYVAACFQDDSDNFQDSSDSLSSIQSALGIISDLGTGPDPFFQNERYSGEL